MRTTDERRRLTFPQRNWLLLCLLAVFITAMAYYLIESNLNNKTATSNQVQTTSSPSSVMGDTQNAKGVPPDSLRH